MGAKEKIAAFLREKLGDDVFTPDIIEGLNELDIDDAPDGNDDGNTPDNEGGDEVDIDAKIEAAINDALEKSNAEWSERYRKTFFGEKPEQDPTPDKGGTDFDMNDGHEPVTLDDIFAESE